jgi:hypothetical protein
MNLNSAALKMMLAKGLTLEDVADIVAANEVTRDPTAKERQARCRARKRAQSQRDVTRDMVPPNESILTPSDATPTPSGVGPAGGSKKSRGTRLPDDWTLPSEWAQWAKERRKWSDTDIAEEALLFANYWQARSGAGAVHRNWFKTWQNWVVRSHRPDGKAVAALTDETARNMERFYAERGDQANAAEMRKRYPQAFGEVARNIVRSAA